MAYEYERLIRELIRDILAEPDPKGREVLAAELDYRLKLEKSSHAQLLLENAVKDQPEAARTTRSS